MCLYPIKNCLWSTQKSINLSLYTRPGPAPGPPLLEIHSSKTMKNWAKWASDKVVEHIENYKNTSYHLSRRSWSWSWKLKLKLKKNGNFNAKKRDFFFQTHITCSQRAPDFLWFFVSSIPQCSKCTLKRVYGCHVHLSVQEFFCPGSKIPIFGGPKNTKLRRKFKVS